MQRRPIAAASSTIIAGLAVAGLAVVGLTVGLLTRAAGPGSAVASLALAALATSLALALLALAGAYFAPRGVLDGLGLAPSRLPVEQLAVLIAGGIGLSHLVDSALRLGGLWENSALSQLAELLAAPTAPELLLAALCIGIAPGVGEELLFRGLCQRSLTRRYGAGIGIVTSALLFGLLHLEPVHALAAGLLGLYLGAVALAAGSTRPAILCHICNNCAALFTAGWEASPPVEPWLVLAAAGAAGWGLRGIVQAIRSQRPASGSLA